MQVPRHILWIFKRFQFFVSIPSWHLCRFYLHWTIWTKMYKCEYTLLNCIVWRALIASVAHKHVSDFKLWIGLTYTPINNCQSLKSVILKQTRNLDCMILERRMIETKLFVDTNAIYNITISSLLVGKVKKAKDGFNKLKLSQLVLFWAFKREFNYPETLDWKFIDKVKLCIQLQVFIFW